jgi:hypothetical protein
MALDVGLKPEAVWDTTFPPNVAERAHPGATEGLKLRDLLLVALTVASGAVYAISYSVSEKRARRS